MGLLGALLPVRSCSVRMCGEWRGGGADADPPMGPIFEGEVGGSRPAAAWTVCRQREGYKERCDGVNV